MENTNKLSNLDKILLKLVFQVDQGTQLQKEVKQQIHIYSATIAKKRQHIDELHVKLSHFDDEINRMQRISAHTMDNFKVWKPTCLLLTQHEDHYEKQLLEEHANTIRDKQMYQDYLKQYRKILQQHQSQYSTFSQAKEYLKKKAAYEEIRCQVLNYTEQMQQKTQFLADLLDSSSFGSLNEWALEIATLKIDTENSWKQITTLAQEKTSLRQYEKQENAAQFGDSESFKEINELQSDLLHFNNLPNIVTSKETRTMISSIHQIFFIFHVPCLELLTFLWIGCVLLLGLGLQLQFTLYWELTSKSNEQQHEYQIIMNTAPSTEQTQSQRHGIVSQRSIRTLKPFKLVRQQSQTEAESEKHKSLQANNILVTQLNLVQKECEVAEDNVPMEFCANQEKSLSKIAASTSKDVSIRDESSGIQQLKKFQKSLTTKNPGQPQYCPFVSNDQEDGVQWLENNHTISVNSDDVTVRKIDASPSNACVFTDSLYKSQALIGLKSMNSDLEKTINDTPQIFPRTPEQVEPGQKEFGMNSNLSIGKTPSKSPGFCFLNTSTPKSTEFNLFGRTAFDLSNTPEQMTDNQMSANQFEFSSLFFKKTPEKDHSSNITSNLLSSQKDIGMDSPSNGQPFTFSFQSDMSSNNFGNNKDEFSFGFSFGQDQKSSQPGLFKFF